MSEYRSIQSFLENTYDVFQEADEDNKKTNDEVEEFDDEEIDSNDTDNKPEDETSDNVGDDDDLDLSDFGNHGGDELPNNEYDPKEVETLNALIASEAAALSEYADAAKTSNVDVLRRLYSDISDEERFHMEQLIFAKSELTGEEYIPRDKDVKKEYEELLALGMDEESAMATAVDKVGVRVKVEETSTDDDVTAEELQKDVETLEAAMFTTELLMMVMEQDEADRDPILMKQIEMFTESYYQEAVMNAGEAPTEVAAPFNPFTALLKLLGQILNGFSILISKFKKWLLRSKLKRIEAKRWFENHGWEGVFANGVSLYIWDDIKGFQFDQMAAYIDGLFIVAKDCGRAAGLSDQYMKYFNNTNIPFDTQAYSYNRLPKREQVLNDLRNLTMTTTKVVFNKNNEKRMIEEWFGHSDEAILPFNPDGNGSTLSQSKNAYNKIAYLLDAATFYCDKTKDLIKGYQAMNGDQNSLWYRDRKAYNENYNAMKEVVKGYNTLMKCFTHDLRWMMWLINDGTKENTDSQDKAEQGRQTDGNVRKMFKDNK